MQRFKYWLILIVTYISIQFFTRLAMIFSTLDNISFAPFELIKTFILGTFYDFISAIFFCMPIALLMIFPKLCRSKLLNANIFIFDFITIFIAVALFLFWCEFHTNFNFIAVDYLIYTHEMLGNIWQSFNILLILPSIFIVTWIILTLQKKFFSYDFDNWSPISFIIYIVIIIFVPILLGVQAKSSWREQVSNNHHNVEIAGNGAYEFVRAFFTNELDYQKFYLTQDDEIVMKHLRNLISTDNVQFLDDNVTRYVDNSNEMSNIKPNVIIITVESLNAEYSKVFGGEISLTPNLDELAKESLIFTKMYATGTRTVRGLEALSLSLPPTPGQSILRRQNNDNLASLGDVFRQNGYLCDFIYGGYGYFDNMNEFFGNNGYTIKDRTTIPDSEIFHETIWGVADEILFSQVIKSMDEHFNNDERAFEMVMTTSNHRPFKFPEGRIEQPEGTRLAAVAYTDWAINDFIKRAQSKPWFDNTIFVIVADHQALAAGKATLPINCYHIPCLIYAPKLIPAGQNDRLISQMDLPPTLLGLIGMSYKSKFLGADINKMPLGQERAFISTYQILGLVKGDTLTVLTPDKKVTAYHIDNWQTSEYTPVDPIMTDEIVAWYQGASYLFKRNLLKN